MPGVPQHLCETHNLGATTSEWLVGRREIPALREIGCLFAGHTVARRGYTFVRHAPAFSQILACTGGEGRVFVDGGWRSLRAGFAYLTAPHAFCAYHVSPGRTWTVCWVLYDPALPLPAIVPDQAPQILSIDAVGLHLAIEGLCREGGGTGDPSLVQSWATLTHNQVLRVLQPTGLDPRLDRLWRAVRHELAADWTLARMARCAGLSEESLRRLCQRHLGRPPLSHLTHLRMHFAADLLSGSAEKIDSIAARVGYSDAFAFSNAFKREMGHPPSHHRARKF